MATMIGAKSGIRFSPSSPCRKVSAFAVALSTAKRCGVLFSLATTALKYLAAGKAFCHDPGCVIAAFMMELGVSADRQKLKVFKSIVVLYFVSMVDMLPSLQLSSNMRLHDDTMFKIVFITNSNSDVPI